MTNPPELTMQQVLSAQHNEWLSHPVTQQMIKSITNLREQYVKTLAGNSSNTSELTEMFRMYSYGIKTADTILTLVKSTNEFVARAEKTK